MFIISFIIGLIIVISSIFMLRRELNTAVQTRSQLVEQAGIYNQDDLFKMLEDLQLSINEMNGAFYEIIGEMEGNISLHEKLISDIEVRMTQYEAAELAVTQAQSQVKRELSENLKRMNQLQEVSRPAEQVPVANGISPETNEKRSSELNVKMAREAVKESSEDTMAKITTLRSQGYALTEIAKMLGMGMGEIQLLINMNHKK
ncbi:MAG: hypothetical protein PWP38_197 [Clostridiales bacterium]|nr:hypothetical protein [Clostridiales bacterium]